MPITLVEQILSSFIERLHELYKLGIISYEHLETTNRNRLNETHSLIVGVLALTVEQHIGKEYDLVALGHGLKAQNERKFTPDISLWKVQAFKKKLVGLIDYESTNSSDSRITLRNFENYRKYVTSEEPSHNIPEFWLIVTTLPSREVASSDWYSWDYRRRRMNKTEYQRMLRNPFQYWSVEYEEKFNTLEVERKKCPLCVANLDSSTIKIYLPKSLN